MVNFTSEQITHVINVAIATRKVKRLITYPGRDIRPDIHILIQGSIGSGKSTLLHEIGDLFNVLPQTSITQATLLGAVDKNTGTVTLPTVWRMRLNLLMIDEIHIPSNNKVLVDVMDTFLSLMEFGHYEKAVGYRCNNLEEIDKDNPGLKLTIKNNIIRCKTRFIFFGNTMYNMRDTKSTQLQAFATRCLIIPYYPTEEETYEAINGKNLYKYKDLNVKKVDVKISKKQHEAIIAFLKSCKVPRERLRRFFGDLCRITAVLGKIDIVTFKLVYEMLTIQFDDLDYIMKIKEDNKNDK